MNRGDYGPIPAMGYRKVRKILTASQTWYAPSDTQPWTPFKFVVIGGAGAGTNVCCVSTVGASGGYSEGYRIGLAPGQPVPVVVGAPAGASSVSLPASCKSAYSSGTISATAGGTSTPGAGAGGDFNLTGSLQMPSYGYGQGVSATTGIQGLVIIEYWTQDINP